MRLFFATMFFCVIFIISVPKTSFSVQLFDLSRPEFVKQKLNEMSQNERDKFFQTPLDTGRIPLIHAVKTENLHLFEIFANAGADMNIRDENDKNAINLAIRLSNPDLARLALKYGTDPKAFTTTYQGSTLIFASDRGEVEIVDMLIKAGAPLNRRNSLGWTALLETTVLGEGGPKHLEVVRLLLEAGADQSISDDYGFTPLYHAKRRGHKKMVELLKSYQ